MTQNTTTSTGARRRGREASLIAAAFALAVGAAAMHAHAATDPGIACSAGKKKAASKLYDGQLKCHVTAMQKGTAVDPECLAKARAKFDAALTKAESKGGCATTGDAAGIAALIDGQVGALNAALPWANPYVCDVGSANETDCNACLNCSLDVGHSCNQSYNTCEAEPDCFAFWDCITPCTNDACVQSCVVNHTYGAQLYSAMINCALSSCPVTCTL